MSNLSILPSMDKILNHPDLRSFRRPVLKKRATEVLDSMRNGCIAPTSFDAIIAAIKIACDTPKTMIKPLINATGILIHTNLGRSPLSREIFDECMECLCGYNNLEFDLHNGQRGERYMALSNLMKDIVGCEDMIVVNNNAAALFLILNTFAKNKEVIISRGELIEIGGGFRIPDVMRDSGAMLHEVGTTNKTNLGDYENAINHATAMLLKIHCSNYHIDGFTSSVSFSDMVRLSQKHQLIDCYDIGGGLLKHTFIHGYKALDNLHREPAICDIIALKPSLVCFSGDKLLGSVQSGIILGKAHFISLLKTNQLLRMLRVDKMTIILLEHYLQAYKDEDYSRIPLLAMLMCSMESLCKRAQYIKNAIAHRFDVEIVDSIAYVGGGTLPQKGVPSVALTLKHHKFDAIMLKDALLKKYIVARIHHEHVFLDMRTVFDDDVSVLIKRLCELS